MQKRVHLIDLVKSFLTSIDLQKSASIQLRSGIAEFANNSPKVRKFANLEQTQVAYADRCPLGVRCPYTHGAKEQLYHPAYSGLKIR